MAVSKRQRFEIFKRDEFTCQYCGRHPPEVVLEVDHVVSRAEGGVDDEHNLITACFDCNRGKGAESLDTRAIALEERLQRLQERDDQVREYERLLSERRERENLGIYAVVGVYERSFPGWSIKERVWPSIRHFLRELPQTEVIEAMDMACSRTDRDRAFRYFCGVCWRKIKG